MQSFSEHYKWYEHFDRIKFGIELNGKCFCIETTDTSKDIFCLRIVLDTIGM